MKNFTFQEQEQRIQYLAGECAYWSLQQSVLGFLPQKLQTICPFKADYDYANERLGGEMSAAEYETFDRWFIHILATAKDYGMEPVIVFLEEFGGHKFSLFTRTYVGKAAKFSAFADSNIDEADCVCRQEHWFIFSEPFMTGLTR